MNKWKNAPEWAMWYAVSKNGIAQWFEYEPELNGTYWFKKTSKGRSRSAGSANNDNWEASLEKRPEQ